MAADEQSSVREALGPPTFHVLGSEDLLALKADLLAKAREQVVAFEHNLEALQNLLRDVYPPHLIAVMAGWGLRTPMGSEGVAANSLIPGIQQHHAELLQALSLTLPADEWGVEPAEPPDIQRAIDLILELADAFSSQRLLATDAETDRQVRAVIGLQERLRSHTQFVRNWARYGEMLRILRDLHGPLDRQVQDKLGYGPLDVINVVEAIVSIVERRVNDHFQLLKGIFAAADIETLVCDYFARFPGVAGDPQEFLADLPTSADLAYVRFRLHVHADRWLVALAVAPVKEIAAAVERPETKVRSILDRLSLARGALASSNIHHLFLANPVWTRPGLRTGDEYFFAFPQTAASFLTDVLRELYEDACLKVAHERRRAAFLEQQTVEVLRGALPGAVVVSGAAWLWDGVSYESDVLVRLDRSLIIAECKSGALSPQGLRGAAERAKRHVEELIVDPSVQSARLQRILEAGRQGNEEALAAARGLGLEPEEIDTVIRLTVTLDDLSVLASADGELKAAGWAPPDLELATTVNLADLACVADLLQRPSHFLHYFNERGRFQRWADVFGFELDFLALYLASGFHIDRPAAVERIAITDLSQPIDLYYANLDLGHPSEKPAPELAPMIAAILDALETRRPTGWTTMALALLQMGGPDEQQDCADAFDQLRDEVAATHHNPEHRNALLYTPASPDRAALVFHVFPRHLGPERNRTIERLVTHVLQTSGLKRCVYLSRQIERWDQPYSAIGIGSVA